MSPVVVDDPNEPVWKQVSIVSVGVLPTDNPGMFNVNVTLDGGVTDEWKRRFVGLAAPLLKQSRFQGYTWVAEAEATDIRALSRRTLQDYVEGVNRHFQEYVVPRLESERDQRLWDKRFAADAQKRLNSPD